MKKGIRKIVFIFIVVMMALGNIGCATGREVGREVLAGMTLGTSELIIGTAEAAGDIARIIDRFARDGTLASYDEIDTFLVELEP